MTAARQPDDRGARGQMTPRRTGCILLDAKSREDACTTSVR